MRSLSESIKTPLLDQHCQWFNGLFGRMFYNVFESVPLEKYFLRKFNRQTSRLKKPFFLSDITVKMVNIGDRLPFFSNAMLHSITDSGEVNVSCDILYDGGFTVQVETEAKIDVPKMKSFQIPLVLAVVVKKLTGKSPPSDRLWLGFYHMPNIDLHIEPVVSSRSVKWSLVHSVIENRIRDSFLEYLVLPNMEDTAIPPMRFKDDSDNIAADQKATDSSLMSLLMNQPRKLTADLGPKQPPLREDSASCQARPLPDLPQKPPIPESKPIYPREARELEGTFEEVETECIQPRRSRSLEDLPILDTIHPEKKYSESNPNLDPHPVEAEERNSTDFESEKSDSSDSMDGLFGESDLPSSLDPSSKRECRGSIMRSLKNSVRNLYSNAPSSQSAVAMTKKKIGSFLGNFGPSSRNE